jgi:hypothetical protein
VSRNESRSQAAIVCERGFCRSLGLTWPIIGSHSGGFVYVLHGKGPAGDQLGTIPAPVLHSLVAHVGAMSARSTRGADGARFSMSGARRGPIRSHVLLSYVVRSDVRTAEALPVCAAFLRVRAVNKTRKWSTYEGASGVGLTRNGRAVWVRLWDVRRMSAPRVTNCPGVLIFTQTAELFNGLPALQVRETSP